MHQKSHPCPGMLALLRPYPFISTYEGGMLGHYLNTWVLELPSDKWGRVKTEQRFT